MKSVTLYTTPLCAYCLAARSLLAEKGIAFDEVDLLAAPERRSEMIARTGGDRRVPQLFVGEEHVGGFDAMYELDRAGRLGPMLRGG